MTTYLVIQTGKHKGRKVVFPREGKLLIGRDPECHLRLASTDVSRKHCEITNTPEGVVVKELGSRNGTFIDGYLISSSAAFHPGSVLRVGNMEFALPGKRSKASSAPKEADDTNDDDIAAWLTHEGETDDPNLEDSTIIPKNKASVIVEEEAVRLDDYSRHPHAQQAADIIRAHWQAKKKS